MVYNGVRDILDVKLAGKWHNNTTDLWDRFNNDKEAYLRTFKFNICAEMIIPSIMLRRRFLMLLLQAAFLYTMDQIIIRNLA